MMIHTITTFEGYNQWLKRLDTQLKETNPKLLRQQIRNLVKVSDSDYDVKKH